MSGYNLRTDGGAFPKALIEVLQNQVRDWMERASKFELALDAEKKKAEKAAQAQQAIQAMEQHLVRSRSEVDSVREELSSLRDAVRSLSEAVRVGRQALETYAQSEGGEQAKSALEQMGKISSKR